MSVREQVAADGECRKIRCQKGIRQGLDGQTDFRITQNLADADIISTVSVAIQVELRRVRQSCAAEPAFGVVSGGCRDCCGSKGQSRSQ